jgi:hypothetical protein
MLLCHGIKYAKLLDALDVLYSLYEKIAIHSRNLSCRMCLYNVITFH